MSTYFGDDGDNSFDGGAAADRAEGKAGNDVLSGNGGGDILAGDAGADTLDGGIGDDLIFTAGITGPYSLGYYYIDPVRPTMDDAADRDVVSGGRGNDTIFAGYGDRIDGGGDYDQLFLSFRGADAGVTADFSVLEAGGTLTIGGAEITNIETVSWIDGSDFDDDLTKGGGDGPVYGWGGNDRITMGYYSGNAYGGVGNDRIDSTQSGYGGYLYGEEGNDTILAGRGSYGFGGGGKDRLVGGSYLDGGRGDDTLDGDDYGGNLHGGEGDDAIYGGRYGNTIAGDAGDDVIYGDSNQDMPADPREATDGDFIQGGTGADIIYGENGDDFLYSAVATPDPDGDGYAFDNGAEHDVVSGGGGDDSVWVGFGDNADGGLGHDTLYVSFAAAASGVNVRTSQLASGTVTGGTITGFEEVAGVRGTEFADHITGAAMLVGGGGDDVLSVTAAYFEIVGGAGNDRLIIAGGGHVIEGGDGIDTVDYAPASAGITVQIGSSHGSSSNGDELYDVENISASRFNDTLEGSSAGNVLLGKAGNDTLFGDDGDDLLVGGAGRDTLTGGIGADVFRFAAGETGATSQSADRITDFSHAEHDWINLSMADAIAATPENDAFRFIGNAAFSGSAGELRYQFTQTDTLVMGDTDGDGVADLMLKLTGRIDLVARDFGLGQATDVAPAHDMMLSIAPSPIAPHFPMDAVSLV